MRAAKALLDAGASANTGFYSDDEFESAIYGAAGVAHHAELVRLLLERGADPNDGETPYHSPETYDNAALQVLVESGKLNEDSLATLLLRKADWHDYEGVRLLLEHGVDPNRITRWGYSALHQAVRRDNALATIELLLNLGADPAVLASGRSAVAMAARRGRADVLDLFEQRGISIDLPGPDQLIAACARNETERIRAIKESDPALVSAVVAEGGQLLAEFAGVGNSEGVGHLLDLGVEVGAMFKDGDGYWGIASSSTALHVAAWRARHSTVKLLIDRGAPIDVADGRGRTPLALAVRACVNSYWTDRRSPESVDALLRAGASAKGITVPTGYAEADELFRASQ